MKYVETPAAPAAIGPYSQAVVAGDWIFCSGQIALDPESGEIAEGGIAEQTDRVMRNLTAVLTGTGASLGDVVKTTIYLTSMEDFEAMNEVYARHLGEHRPARATVEVTRLPKNVEVEIDLIAFRGTDDDR